MALPPPKPPARKRTKMPERKKLNVGQFIASEKFAYKIESILGSGGFGDVYKVVVVKDEEKKYAMKTEYFDPRKRKLLNRLKVEMGVFTEIQHAPPARRKHFIQMVDKGQTELFKFIVMEIVSYSLEDIRKYMLGGKLSWQAAIKVASQTLIAIGDLHSVGYIHRDIKPHNFAIGRPPLASQIYMLDFGIARRYMDKDGKIRVPRERVTFLGTVKFASRNCHSEKEQSRMDDLEVWIYMVLELFEQENLIWRRQTDRAQILALKERMFSHTDDLELRAPTGFKKIMEYVKKLLPADQPDYAFLDTQLWACAKAEKLDMTQHFDWVDKVMPEKKAKKKAPAARLENDDDSEDRRRRQKREEKAKKEPKDKDTKKGDRTSEGKKDGEHEHETDDDDDEETKDKKGSKEGEGTKGVSMTRGVKKEKSKDTSKDKESKMGEVDEKTKRGSVEKDKDKRSDAGASKMQRPGDNKRSERQPKSARRKDSKRSVKQKKKDKESVKEKKQPTSPLNKNVSVMVQPTGPDEANFVKSGYLSIEMPQSVKAVKK